MKAFVTGSTGLLGSNLVACLLRQGYEVQALVRSIEKGQRVLGNHSYLQFVQGDMRAVANFASHLQDCDILFHAAAYFREYYGLGDHWPQLEQINIQGTLSLLEAADQAGIQKVIYLCQYIGLSRSDGRWKPQRRVFSPRRTQYRQSVLQKQSHGRGRC
ncbi:3 beta-hydroxysteroid dehydrogenase/Delta 5--_4-isomerase [Acaryochloris thomasi RCC1774]|uniref:3 beta-hydroxysteroid dehydrogenase/Delta 5-->4-isomerase n=1 Tax=Acaryochloris thomasi RCC1774 TaxID=1764569 RepID=A0A2W1J731_9CYAN|nr:NAD-dependent epimerase/dehydratase family protein [Acaryochloris thomasi]PZD70339.1 3 beta-hydroxysteroid dehydrogenase/Delta 5-->4-isomerase [Acaryochloris thomasi RCC1774]